MYKNKIRFDNSENIAHPCQHAGGNIIEILTLFHDVEVIIRHNIKQLKHLVKHFTMLSGYSNYGFECIGMLFKFLYQGSHFNCFRSGTEDNQNLFLFH